MKTLSKTMAAVGLSAFMSVSNAQEHDGHAKVQTGGHEHHHGHHMAADDGQAVLQKSPIEDSSLAGLIDYDGNQVKDADFEGKKRLVFFGFTNCPSVCPTGMATLSSALRQVDEKHGEAASDALDDTAIVMVSTDPARDTPERMKEWLGYFDDRIIGLTGDANMLEEKAQNYRADRMGHHSPYLYVLDEQGAFAGLVNTQKGTDAVVQMIEDKVLAPSSSSKVQMDHSAHHNHHDHHDM